MKMRMKQTDLMGVILVHATAVAVGLAVALMVHGLVSLTQTNVALAVASMAQGVK